MRVVVVVAVALLAGCGAKEAPQQVVVVDSQETQFVEASSAAAKGTGILRGVVVDEALFVVAGAKVMLPGLGESRVSDKDGRFAFDSLWPGPYFIQADAKGYRAVQADVVVEKERPTEVRIELERNPPEDPYHTTVEFQGHGEWVSSWTFGILGTECAPCSFRVALDAPADTLIVEAARTTGGDQFSGFTVRILDSDGREIAWETTPDPGWVRADAAALHNATVLYVEARPRADVAPEAATDFEVFVTSFHNGPAPEAWSYLEGDP